MKKQIIAAILLVGTIHTVIIPLNKEDIRKIKQNWKCLSSKKCTPKQRKESQAWLKKHSIKAVVGMLLAAGVIFAGIAAVWGAKKKLTKKGESTELPLIPGERAIEPPDKIKKMIATAIVVMNPYKNTEGYQEIVRETNQIHIHTKQLTPKQREDVLPDLIRFLIDAKAARKKNSDKEAISTQIRKLQSGIG